mgnify:CR=1 FL=1
MKHDDRLMIPVMQRPECAHDFDLPCGACIAEWKQAAELADELAAELLAASDHLDYIGFGDSWERDVAEANGLEPNILAALAKYDAQKVGRREPGIPPRERSHE